MFVSFLRSCYKSFIPNKPINTSSNSIERTNTGNRESTLEIAKRNKDKFNLSKTNIDTDKSLITPEFDIERTNTDNRESTLEVAERNKGNFNLPISKKSPLTSLKEEIADLNSENKNLDEQFNLSKTNIDTDKSLITPEFEKIITNITKKYNEKSDLLKKDNDQLLLTNDNNKNLLREKNLLARKLAFLNLYFSSLVKLEKLKKDYSEQNQFKTITSLVELKTHINNAKKFCLTSCSEDSLSKQFSLENAKNWNEEAKYLITDIKNTLKQIP